jgi:hypothetical protein
VEWCYEQIGEGIVPFDEVPFPLFPILPSMFPKQLFSNLSEFTPVPPSFYVISPQWHDTVQGEVSIIVDVSDGENGSGPYVVKAFLDHEPIYPPLDKYSSYYIGEDKHLEDIEGIYIIQWNTSHLEEGLHTIYIRAYDQAGNYSDGYVEVYVEPTGGPCIQYYYPPDGAENIPVNTKITMTFTRPMDTISVMNAVVISPGIFPVFKWSNDLKTVTIRPSDTLNNLKYETVYTVEVLPTAQDTAGNSLDPECAISFSFKTKSPEFELTVIPQTAKVPIGDTIFHNIKVFNKNPRTEVFELNFNVFQTSQILRYILPSQTQFEIPKNGEVSTILKVYDPRDPEGCDYGNVSEFDYLGIKVTARVLNTQKEIFKKITDEPEKIDNAPTITSTSPSDGEQNVKINKDIKISFSKAMDTASVRSAISINPSVEIISYEWSLLRLLCLSGYCVYCVGV